MYELQIEVCQMQLDNLTKADLDNYTKEQIAESRKKIEAEIENLRKTKQPILKKHDLPGNFMYSHERAEYFRMFLKLRSSDR